MGRIIGDTAIITILLGATLKNEPVGSVPILGTLRGTGSTLTSYVYDNSPAGEGNAPQKAYAAAFVLLMIVLALNALVTRLTGARGERAARARLRAQMLPQVGGAMDPLMPPPVRRIDVDREPHVAPPPRRCRTAAARRSPPRAPQARAAARRRVVRERMRDRIGVARLRRELGRARRQPARAPGRGARR